MREWKGRTLRLRIHRDPDVTPDQLPGVLDGVARDLVDREDVVAVHRDPGNAIGLGLVGQSLDGGLLGRGRRIGEAVVLDDDHRARTCLPLRGQQRHWH